MDPEKNIICLVPGHLPGTSYYERALQTVTEVAAQQGYGCVRMIESDITAKMQSPAWTGRLDTAVAGIIVYSPNAFDYDSYLRLFCRQKYPCVLIRRKTGVPGVAVLRDDDAAGTRLALEHLYGLGHRTIGFFRRWSSLYGSERKSTWRRFLREHGLSDDPRLGYEVPSSAAGRKKDMHLTWLDLLPTLPSAPTAFVCYNDPDAQVLVQALAQRGRRVPQDMAIVGYDDSEVAAACHPPLTSVHIPIEEMCAAAVKLIAEGKTADAPPEVIFPNTLVVRQSCGAPPESMGNKVTT